MVAIYVRVSTAEQGNAGSIQNQLTLAEKYIRDNGIIEYEVYSDEGISGGKEDITTRPAMMKMINDIKKGYIAQVWAFDLSRISRNMLIHTYILNTLKKEKIRLILNSGEMNLNSPTDFLLSNLLGSFAEYEREMIKLRTKLGRDRKMAIGDYAKPSIFGYTKYKNEVGKTCFKVNKKEADLMRYLYNGYLEGNNLRTMREYIEAYGVKSWFNFYVSLKNPTYKGFVYNSNKELVKSRLYEPIVSEETWKKVNEILSENGKRWKSQFKNAKYLGSGLLICGMCGAKYYQDKVKKGLYYYRHLRANRNNCQQFGSTIKKETFDTIIEFVFKYVFLNDLMLKHNYGELQKRAKKIEEENNEKTKMIRKNITEANKKLSNILQAIESGIKAEMFVNKAVTLENEIKTMEESINTITESTKTEKIDIENEMMEFQKNKLKEYKEAGIERRRELILELVIASVKIKDVIIVSTKFNRHFIFNTHSKKQNEILECKKDTEILKKMNKLDITNEREEKLDGVISAIIEKNKREPYHYEVYDLRVE